MTLGRTTRRIVWAVAGLVLLCLLALGLVLGAPRTEVEVAEATRGTFTRYVEEDGWARVRERYAISAPVVGTLERIGVHPGDRVARGDVVAVLHPTASPLLDPRARSELEARRGGAEAALAGARATAERAEASLAHAESELARTRRLGSAATAQELEHAELEATVAARELRAARFAVRVAEHELEMARAALAVGGGMSGDTILPLEAPADGRVLRVLHENEGVVAPGVPLVEIGDPSALEIVVDLLSTDAVLVEPGVEAEITGWGSRASLRARVRLVEPTASIRLSALGVEERRVDVVLDPIDGGRSFARVGEGYLVDVRIPVERLTNVVRIPTSALFRVGERWCVFVVRDRRVHRVTVGVTSYGPLESAVEKGLSPGDVVVLEAPEDLAEGERVDVRPRAR